MVYWLCGKLFGGFGLINVMVYCCGFLGDFEDWEVVGVVDWGWIEVWLVFEWFEIKLLLDGKKIGFGLI